MVKVVFPFTGNRPITNMIEKMSNSVGNMSITLYEHENCKAAHEAVLHTQSELSVLKPLLKVQVSDEEVVMTEADLIILAGLHLELKTDVDFTKIVTKLISKYLPTNLKESAKILVNGCFRGLITAKIIADVVPSHKKKIYVLDQIAFAGGRILGYSKTDALLYSTQTSKLLVPGININVGQRTKVQTVIDITKRKRLESIEDTMIAEAVQYLLVEDQEEGLEFYGRFPEEDERKFYEIDDSVPVFLPASRETEDRLKSAVKKVNEEMKAMFPALPNN